ncbi:MAG: hypothetical protein Hyperionvirus28_27 [Hyperionvirus sp.]|uniref:Uncharacterized protein n=1 Tax=Hyperionvirus sp. TaxID=2487770 RepID=A0A3G5AGL6_9VIRU|nr:MAG: hypothetical protein Hyperionvirus28_27 [Hyperionvirus sp.]
MAADQEIKKPFIPSADKQREIFRKCVQECKRNFAASGRTLDTEANKCIDPCVKAMRIELNLYRLPFDPHEAAKEIS